MAGPARGPGAGAAGAARRAAAAAPCKAILFGEHFVVHGSPAVACAVGRRVSAAAGPLRRGVRVESPLGPACEAATLGSDMPGGLPAPLAAVCRIAMSAARRRGAGLCVRVDSRVPLGSGLGASSAWCVAAVAAVRAAFGEECGAAGVAAAALRAERASFGNASGVDTAACAYGGFGVYRTGGWAGAGWRPAASGGRLRLVVGDTGMRHSTAEMVGAVSRFRDRNRAEFAAMSDESASIARKGERAIGGGDVSGLGRLMSESHALLSRLGVSTGEADALAEAATGAGSPGAKITGAGGGGCVIALPGPGKAGEAEVSKAMLDAGAAGCFAADAGVAGVEISTPPPPPPPSRRMPGPRRAPNPRPEGAGRAGEGGEGERRAADTKGPARAAPAHGIP